MKNLTPRGRSAARVAAVAVAATLVFSGCSTASPEVGAQPSERPTTAPTLDFTGPSGEKPESLEALVLEDADKAALEAGDFTAAFVWHTSSEFVSAVEASATAEFDKLGIEVVASTQADFDAATQANNIETVLALQPDVIIATAVDPTSAAASFAPAVEKGTKLVIMTTPPAGFTAGKEFVSIVTVSLTEAGKFNAELLGDAMGGEGKVGFLFHDADFWFTNQRDQAFVDWLSYDYPNIEITAEEGFTDEASTQEIAAAMIARNPDITGIYVAWATAAQGVLAAIRDAGRTDIKVVTNDLDATLAADMVKGGSVVGLVGNGSTSLGQGLATAAAFGVLDKQAPALVTVTPSRVVSDTIEQGWLEDYGVKPPASVTG